MRGFCKWLPQRGEGSWHWEGSWEAILRVLQRQSWFTAWSAPQQSGLGFVLGAPGTTNGAHTFRLFSWFEHPSLFCAPPISISVPNATANKSNTATWDLSDIIDLTPAMSLKTFFFVFFLTGCLLTVYDYGFFLILGMIIMQNTIWPNL